MLSIKQFMDRRRTSVENQDVLPASLQLNRLLLDAIATHMVRGRDADAEVLGRTLRDLGRKMETAVSALGLLAIGSEAIEALETHSQRTADYFREENRQMQAMVAMLTETLADVSGQADASVGRLQSIEHQIERASSLDDMKALSASLETCLTSLREAAAHQRKGYAATVQRLRDQIEIAQTRATPERARTDALRPEIDLIPEPLASAPKPMVHAYVAAFKLQRADHVATRFGESAKHQMLALISQSLKGVLGPEDRLLRWKGTSFIMFLCSTATLIEIRTMLADVVAKPGQHYIEVGKKTALLSVGVDWIVFPQSQCPSLDAVFNEVDAFLAADLPAGGFRTTP